MSKTVTPKNYSKREISSFLIFQDPRGGRGNPPQKSKSISTFLGIKQVVTTYVSIRLVLIA